MFSCSKFFKGQAPCYSNLRRKYYFADDTNRRNGIRVACYYKKSPIVIAALREGILISIPPQGVLRYYAE